MLNSILTHGVRSVVLATTLGAGLASASVNEAKVETLTYELTPERKALLDTIRYAEGTWANGDPIGYRIMFGGSTFDDFSRHPDRVIYGGRYASAAAGAYQFMPLTWRRVASALKLNSFGPQEQDQAALWLVQQRGALPEIDRGRFSPETVGRLSPEWASFPTVWGGSYYGQPVKDYRDLHRFFHQKLKEYQQPVVPAIAEEAPKTTHPQLVLRTLSLKSPHSLIHFV